MTQILAEQMRSLSRRLDELANMEQVTSEGQKSDVPLSQDQISRVLNAIKDLSLEGNYRHYDSYPRFYTAKTIAAHAGKDITPKHVRAAVWNATSSDTATLGGRIIINQLKLRSDEPNQYSFKPATNEAQKDDMTSVELEGSLNATQLAKLLGLKDINLFSRTLKKLQKGDMDKLTPQEKTELAVAFDNLLAADAEDTQKAMTALKRVSAKEEPMMEASKAEIQGAHRGGLEASGEAYPYNHFDDPKDRKAHANWLDGFVEGELNRIGASKGDHNPRNVKIDKRTPAYQEGLKATTKRNPYHSMDQKSNHAQWNYGYAAQHISRANAK
jgi:hypothetical protein